MGFAPRASPIITFEALADKFDSVHTKIDRMAGPMTSEVTGIDFTPLRDNQGVGWELFYRQPLSHTERVEDNTDVER